MGKRQHQTKAIRNHNTITVEQNTAVDDSLLPAADELIKLQQIDPTIVDWVKQRAEMEQNARLKFNEDRMGEFKKSSKRAHLLNTTSLIMAFVIIL